MTNEEFIESIRLEGEEWKDVVGYEGYYKVSNFGRFVSIKTECINVSKSGKVFKRHFKSYLCKIQSNCCNTDYCLISLTKEGKRKTYTVHRLVAISFISNPNNYPCIDHIDDNPKNNKADNLQWCTYHTNNIKEHRLKTQSSSAKGKPKPDHIKKPIISLKDGKLFKKYSSMWEAHLAGYHSSCILKVIKGKQNEHKGFKWMYLSDYEKLVSKPQQLSLFD